MASGCIEEQLVRRAQARSGARKAKLATRKAARDFIRAFASTGRRAVVDETGPHPFRLPPQKSATAVDNMAKAVGVQQDSREARRNAQGAIEAALAQGSRIVADLDVTVPNALRGDTSRLAEWAGARRMDHQSSPREANPDTPITEAVSNRSAVVDSATHATS